MNINEEILDSWLELTNTINNERIVSDMPFNELLIYRLIYNKQTAITATDLCNITKMMKSQMNRTLIAMEKKNYIKRVRSSEDKRKIFITINEESLDIYHQEHKRIISIVDNIVKVCGEDAALKVLEVFRMVSKIAKEEIK